VRQAIAAHLGSREVSRVLHGSIIGLALVVALEAHPPRAGVVAVTLLTTAIAFGLADVYSEMVGTETQTRARVQRPQLLEILDGAAAAAIGTAFPAVFFVLAALGVFDVDAAFELAKWSGLGLITAYGYAAARLTGARGFEAVRRAALAAVIGGFLILIKALVH
jgi:ABC-type transport system involved in cytochrome c biogenesis permease subunit